MENTKKKRMDTDQSFVVINLFNSCTNDQRKISNTIRFMYAVDLVTSEDLKMFRKNFLLL